MAGLATGPAVDQSLGSKARLVSSLIEAGLDRPAGRREGQVNETEN